MTLNLSAQCFFLHRSACQTVVEQECELASCYVWYVGSSEPKDSVPSIFTSPWVSHGPARIDTGCAGRTTNTWNSGQLSAYLHDPSQSHSTKDERWRQLGTRVRPRAPVARGIRTRLTQLHLSLCAPNPRGPWTMSHSGLGREQRSHLTRGLTSRLVGVWRRPEERHTSPRWKLDQLVPSDDPGCDHFHFAPLTSKSSLISPWDQVYFQV